MEKFVSSINHLKSGFQGTERGNIDAHWQKFLRRMAQVHDRNN